MKATHETAASAASRIYAFGPFQLHVCERRLLRDGIEIALTSKAFDVLLTLVEGAGRLQGRDALIRSVWQGVIVEEHGLTGYLSMVRKALDDTGPNPHYIQTVRGHGYRFVAPVEIVAEEPAEGVSIARTAASSNDAATPQRSGAYARVASARHVGRNRSLLAAVLVAIVAGVAWFSHDRLAPAAPSPLPRSIAVLPFENLGPDTDIAYFVSGIQNIVTVKLAGIADLRVVSRSSTEKYASRPADLAAVAGELGVASVLEGSVQKAGAQVLLSVQLVDGQTGKTVWAQTYTRTLDDVFLVESEIAEQVALALKATIQPLEVTRVASLPTGDAQAHVLFLQADYFAWQLENWGASHTRDLLDRAADLYRQAIARDDRFALAFARLSYLESYAYWTFIDHAPQRIAEAEQAAQHATSLAPELPQARLAMGYVHYYGHRDYAAALREFEQAGKDLPNDAEVVGAIAHIRRRQGRLQDALAGYEKGAALDPRNSNWPNLIADTQAMLREYAQAGASYERARAIDPTNPYALINRAAMLLFNAESTQASQALQQIPPDAGPVGVIQSMRYQIAWLEHQPERALAELADAPDWIDDPWLLGSIPTSLLRAMAIEFRGEDDAAAKREYEAASVLLQNVLRDDPDNPTWLSLLGMVEAGLGHAEEAVRLGTRASERVPLQADAYDGPYYLTALAQIQARVGNTEAARELVRQLLAIPAGLAISEPLVRRDPRFRALWETRNAR